MAEEEEGERLLLFQEGVAVVERLEWVELELLQVVPEEFLVRPFFLFQMQVRGR